MTFIVRVKVRASIKILLLLKTVIRKRICPPSRNKWISARLNPGKVAEIWLSKKISFKAYFFVYAPSMHYNGPAIKGGCGTWRSHPATYPGTLAEIVSRWQDRYGVLFANPDTRFIAWRRDRGISFIGGRKWFQVDEVA
jgi:hypothetical protein